MSDQTPPSAAQETPAPPTPEEQFQTFETEAFTGGEPLEDAAEKPAEKGEPAAQEGGGVPDEGAGDGTDEGAPGEAPKKVATAQERINELTRARRQAEREAAELRKRLEALEARAEPKEPAPKEPEAAKKEALAGPPKPDDFEFGELDSEYIAAVVKYEAGQQIAEFRQSIAQEREQAAAAEQQRAMQEKFQQQAVRGKEKYDDFEEKVVRGAQEGAWPLSETLGPLLVESEVGEDIAYHLATNPQEAEEVFRLSPVEQARYFGKVEAKFSAARAAATGGEAEKPATTRAPKAPAPVPPVKGAGGRFQPSASTDDFAAFEAAANRS